jgi:uncharacterized membrane protein
MGIGRILKHLLKPAWLARRVFRPADVAAIQHGIALSERSHRGELRFVIEGPLPLGHLLAGRSPRARALELFSSLRVWDTAENSGILIYVQLVDRRVEVLADRGIAAKVGQDQWDAICREMETAFKARAHRRGALEAIDRATRLLNLHYPARGEQPNELPDRPVLL